MEKHRIKDIAALRTFAREFAADLKGGCVIGLVGDLGAGKTAFVKEVADAMGVNDDVKSPTFVLMQIYRTGAKAAKRGIEQLCHIDAYRLDDYAALQGIGFLEYATDPSTVTFIEWADRVPEVHALAGFRELTFLFGDGEERTVVFSA